MLYIGQVKYKMTEDDKWNKGWLVGESVDSAETLLDENFIPVPKIIDDDGDEWVCWDSGPLLLGGIMVQL